MTYTPKQLKILEYIKEYIKEHSYSPTIVEIAENFKVSGVTVFEHLTALEKKGAIRRQKHEMRSIELLEGKQKLYKHYKGDLYEFITEAKHSDTGEDLIIYKALKSGQVWVRPKASFFGKVDDHGISVDRFTEAST